MLVKKAAGWQAIQNAFGAVKNHVADHPVSTAVGLVTGGMALHKAYKAIENDFQRKAILADLLKSDPMLQEVDPQQVKEWYATIYHFAPHFSLDKTSVREVLDNFARFGKVDIQTLKLLAETDKAYAGGGEKGTSWGGLLQDVAGSAAGLMLKSEL